MIGASVPRLEDRALLCGRGRYVDDIAIADVLHAAFVRSPHPHALIGAVRGEAARTVPGVVGAVNGARSTSRVGHLVWASVR